MDTGDFRYVYGPVPSRRLGRSLGVDLVHFKTCSYDCIYCQLGKTTRKTLDRKEYVPLDEVMEELERKLACGPNPDYIGIAGSGEPTLHVRLGELVGRVKKLTDTPVAVLTNGSLLWMPNVRDELMEADLVLPSLDAGDERMFATVNRPHESLSFEVIIAGIASFTRQFRGEVRLEVFLLDGLTGNRTEAEKIADLAGLIGPSRVQLNTIHRPAAVYSAAPVPWTRMVEMAGFFRDSVEIISPGERTPPVAPFKSGVREEEIMALISRRPCTAFDVSSSLGIHLNEVLKQLERLTAAGRIGVINSEGSGFYSVVAGSESQADTEEMRRYHASCRSEFWNEVFRKEIDYLHERLKGARTVLSVGCGPAMVEKGLSDLGFEVTGLDVSCEALGSPPDQIRTVVAQAGKIPLPSASFDAVIFVVSLQFIDDFRQALEEAFRVLRLDGRIIVMLLNPESGFFKGRYRDPKSYISRIKHTDLEAIEEAISDGYEVRTGYLLGIKGNRLFESTNSGEAALFVIQGSKKLSKRSG